jgi:hypothetical protein
VDQHYLLWNTNCGKAFSLRRPKQNARLKAPTCLTIGVSEVQELALMLNRLVVNGDSVPQKLKDYAGGQWQRESVKQWVRLPRAT